MSRKTTNVNKDRSYHNHSAIVLKKNTVLDFIAMATIGLQVVRAAIANPVKSLRSE